MTDDDDCPLPAAGQVAILRRVAGYDALREAVRKTSVGSLMSGGLMVAVWYLGFPDPIKYSWFGIVYIGLAVAEVATGLLNRFAPSAEGVLLDGAVTFLFGVWNLLRAALIWQGLMPGQIQPVFVLFGGYWVYQGVQHFRTYGALRRQFADRPTAAHIRWYNGLLREVRYADPKEDAQSLALPTRPPVTAKLLGDVAFFAVVGGGPIIAAREDVLISKLDSDDPDARPEGVLVVEGSVFDPFPLSPANWDNYRRWKDEAT